MDHIKYENFVPLEDVNFVPSGNYEELHQIISSNKYFPVFITGLSGNGKTMSVEQVCAKLGRKLIRVNLTTETDSDDLYGGFRLVDGNTVWFDGPVVIALRLGAILLLDEVDLGSNKIMCLQRVLEGKGVFLPKINQYVEASPGFNIIATANTKGQGSESGKFVGTNILNEAFLERFPATFEQKYPEKKTEMLILRNVFKSLNVNKSEYGNYLKCLIKWANITRESYDNEASTDLISTRRLVHIANAFAILKNRSKAIEVCIARFDEVTKQSFMELYEKIDIEVSSPKNKASTPESENNQSMDDVETICSILGGKGI
jgi:midasin (ATPase involved in ribosome maturation)